MRLTTDCCAASLAGNHSLSLLFSIIVKHMCHRACVFKSDFTGSFLLITLCAQLSKVIVTSFTDEKESLFSLPLGHGYDS